MLKNNKQYFEDRRDAGIKLAAKLLESKYNDPYILALPRGGVPVGYEVARLLNAPINIIVSRKLGAPTNPEYGVGAISENGSYYLDLDTISALGIKQTELAEILMDEEKELIRRIGKYRNGRKLPFLDANCVLLVDDGLATGVTARAAIDAVKYLKPKKLIFAAPVCASDTVGQLEELVDDIVCLFCPNDLKAIGTYYKNFNQITDKEVLSLLKSSIKY